MELIKGRERLICGIIMPISSIGPCGTEHWLEVLGILNGVVKAAGFKPTLVSHSEESGVLLNRILENIKKNPIILCDISCLNPNVIFELGVRIGCSMPFVIIKDDETKVFFDISGVEYIEYPRNMDFSKIAQFTTKLKNKLKSTYQKTIADPNHLNLFKPATRNEIFEADKQSSLNSLSKILEMVTSHIGTILSKDQAISVSSIYIDLVAKNIAKKINEVMSLSEEDIFDVLLDANNYISQIASELYLIREKLIVFTLINGQSFKAFIENTNEEFKDIIEEGKKEIETIIENFIVGDLSNLELTQLCLKNVENKSFRVLAIVEDRINLIYKQKF